MTALVPVTVEASDRADAGHRPTVSVYVSADQAWIDALPEDWTGPALRAYGFLARTFVRAFTTLPHGGLHPDNVESGLPEATARDVLGERDGQWLAARRRHLRLDAFTVGTVPDDGAAWTYEADGMTPADLRRALPMLERLAASVVADTAAELVPTAPTPTPVAPPRPDSGPDDDEELSA